MRSGALAPPLAARKLVSFWVAQKVNRTESLLRHPLRVDSCAVVAIFIRVHPRLRSSFAFIRVIRGQWEDLTAETQRAQREEGATAKDAKDAKDAKSV